MTAILTDDFIDYQCPNINCDSTDFGTISDFDDYSILKCKICGEEFYVSYSSKTIWRNTGQKDDRGNPIINEIAVIKHPKSADLEEKHPLDRWF